MAVVLMLTACEILSLFLSRYNPFLKKHSLFAKIASSLLFLSVGIASILYTNEINKYTWRILAGLLFGVLGDFLLENKKTFFFGGASFAVGHILYIGAFIRGFDTLLYKYWFFYIVFAVIYAVYTALAKKAGIVYYNGKFLPIALYAVALIFMCVAAVSRAVLLVINGEYLLASVIAAGGILFVVSDSCLGLSMFSQKKIRRARKIVHFTYFPAQTLLALSILLI